MQIMEAVPLCPLSPLCGPALLSSWPATHTDSICDQNQGLQWCSVLESGRTITLSEKGGEVVTAAAGFRIAATMNPGGDYGKRELSPALSNRFTQAWIPAVQNHDELLAILESRLKGIPTAPTQLFSNSHCLTQILMKNAAFGMTTSSDRIQKVNGREIL